MTTPTVTTTVTPGRTCTPAQRVTKSLLGYGVLAGVVFEASILIQGLTRHGFRIAHDDASLLSNGPLGWIQIATFLLAGAMTIAAAWYGSVHPTPPGILKWTPFVAVVWLVLGIGVLLWLRARRPDSVAQIGSILGEEGGVDAAVLDRH